MRTRSRNLAAALALCLTTALALAAPAFATEGISSFKTTLSETNEAGFGAFTGVVTGGPSGNTFTIESRSGQSDTVEVNAHTKFPHPEYGEANLSDIGPGEHVIVFGHLAHAGAIAHVGEVVIEPLSEEVSALPSLEFFTEGRVLSPAAGESLTIETGDGTTETIEASPSTTYARSRPKPGEGAEPPTISDIAPGDYLAPILHQGEAPRVSRGAVSAA